MPCEMSYKPRNIVNGALLKQHMGKEVSIFVKVEDVDPTGATLVCKSSDGKDIRVTLAVPLDRHYQGWVEVIGTPTSVNSVHCRELMFFEEQEGDEEFDTNAHNMMILFWMNCQDIYKKG